MNSYIFTETGISIVALRVPYVISNTHVNFDAIKDALRESNFEAISELSVVATAIENYIGPNIVEINVEAGTIQYNGKLLHGVIVEHILKMMADNFEVAPMILFLTKLYQNPSAQAIDQLYGWMVANGVTISENGNLVAWKRVKDNYTSFHDSVTKHAVGTYVELKRSLCTVDATITCAAGLHFCSYEYLEHYNAGQGRILMLEIDPTDVVSIPSDYNNAKGRACKYYVSAELNGEAREVIETSEVLVQPVITKNTDVNATVSFKHGYQSGYKDGRGKKALHTSWDVSLVLTELNMWDNQDLTISDSINENYHKGYDAGRIDGRTKQPKLY